MWIKMLFCRAEHSKYATSIAITPQNEGKRLARNYRYRRVCRRGGAFVPGLAAAPLYTVVRLTLERPKEGQPDRKIPEFPPPLPLTIPPAANDPEPLHFVRFSPTVAPNAEDDSKKRA